MITTTTQATQRQRLLGQLPRGLMVEAESIWTEIANEVRQWQLDGEVLHNSTFTCSPRQVLSEELFAPVEQDEDWPEPTRPHPVGNGWVHWDTIDDDEPLLAAMAETWSKQDARQVAVEAQNLRLPVVDYRPRPLIDRVSAARRQASTDDLRSGQPRQTRIQSSRPLVVDLTTHWAGPLATKLSTAAGMDVVKVDPRCRPDGFRNRPGLYRHLNDCKQKVDLDLRRPKDRLEFEAMLAKADVLVESFSRRVLPNFGYSGEALRRSYPNLSVVSIRAFSATDPCADWLAYGGGVHAASGLAFDDEQPQPAPLPYPDFLTGLRGFQSILRASVTPGGRYEESLANSIKPLLGFVSLVKPDESSSQLAETSSAIDS